METINVFNSTPTDIIFTTIEGGTYRVPIAGGSNYYKGVVSGVSYFRVTTPGGLNQLYKVAAPAQAAVDAFFAPVPPPVN